MPPVDTVAKPSDEATTKPDAAKAPKAAAKTAGADVVSSAPSGSAPVASAADQEAELAAMLAEEEDLNRRQAVALKTKEAAERLAKRRKEVSDLEADAAKTQADANKLPSSPALQEKTAAQREIEQEAERATKVEREAAQAAAKAEEDEITRQSKSSDGEIDRKKVAAVGERAADVIRRKAMHGNPTGVYVLSPIEVMGPLNTRVTLPKGARMTSAILAQHTEEQLETHFRDGILEDLR